jgi:putative peptidoglycan lipid II flippase
MTPADTPEPAGDPSARREQRSILRSAGIMTLMTLISRVLGLVREQIRALYLGTGASSDAFGLAATIPNLFRRLFAEGVMTAAFVPTFTEYLRTATREETRRFLSRFVTLLTVAVTGFTVLAILLTPWLIDTFFASEFKHVPGKVALTIALTELMWPYLVLVSIAAVLQGILNAHRIFGPSAFAPVLMNLAIIVFTVALAGSLEDPSYALVIGFLAGGVLQLVFQIPFLLKQTPIRFGIDFHFRDPGVLRVLRIMGPGVFSAGIYQFNVFFAQLIASSLDEGSVASLQYSLRLQELVLGVFVVSVTQVILPSLSDHTARNDDSAVRSTLSYALRLIAFVTLPCTAALMIVAPEIISALFRFGAFDDESTRMTAEALRFHALGLFFIGQGRVVTQAFFAYKDLRTPMFVSLGDAVLNVGLCYLLAMPLGHGGIALASTIAALGYSVVLQWLLYRRMGGGPSREVFFRTARIAFATMIMAGVMLVAPHVVDPGTLSRPTLLLWLLAVLGLGAAVFYGASSVLRVNELNDLMAAVKRRLRGRKR